MTAVKNKREQIFEVIVIVFWPIDFAEKDRELGAAQGEIKGLRATEVLKDKALEEVLKEYLQIDLVIVPKP